MMREVNDALYLISLAIGTSTDMTEMLDMALTAYRDNLGCDVCAILDLPDNGRPPEVVYCYPSRKKSMSIMSEIIDMLDNVADLDSNYSRQGIYYEGLTDSNFLFFLFSVPGTGFLVLVSREPVLDNEGILFLEDLNSKLALACSMCREFEVLKELAGKCQRELEGLKITMDRFELAMRASGTGIVEYRVPGRELFIGPCVYDLLGYDPYEFPPLLENWKKLVHPDDMKRDFCSELFLQGSRDSYETRYRIKNKKGHWIWIECKVMVAERDGSGRPSRIVCTVTDITMRKTSQQQLQSLYRELYYSANNDHLTGLFNRQRIYFILEDEIDRAGRYNSPLSLIMLDIDNFKDINDQLGHQTGDRILEQLAEILRSRVRRTDRIGRWGGDEFMIVVIGDIKSASLLAEDLRRTVERADFDISLPVSLSMGISSYRPVDDRDTFVSRADEALYIAKRKGKNSVVTLM